MEKPFVVNEPTVAMPIPPNTPWRSVRFALPVVPHLPGYVSNRYVARLVVSKVLTRLGLPRRQGSVRFSGRRGYQASIRIYRGLPSEEDKLQLRQALDMAREELGKRVGALRAVIEE